MVSVEFKKFSENFKKEFEKKYCSDMLNTGEMVINVPHDMGRTEIVDDYETRTSPFPSDFILPEGFYGSVVELFLSEKENHLLENKK